EVVTEIAAVLAMTAVRNNDRVGLLLYTDRVEHVVPPRKGRRHALRVLRDVLGFHPVGRGTNTAAALEYLNRLLSHHAIVFVMSDFQDETVERPLKLLVQRHDVVAVTVTDPAERELPDLGLARLEDPETGELVDVDTSDAAVREAFANRVTELEQARRRLLRRLAVDEVEVRTNEPYVGPLLDFFRARETRIRRR